MTVIALALRPTETGCDEMMSRALRESDEIYMAGPEVDGLVLESLKLRLTRGDYDYEVERSLGL